MIAGSCRYAHTQAGNPALYRVLPHVPTSRCWDEAHQVP